MPVYSFDSAKVIPLKNINRANPQGIGECLERVRTAHNGRLKPADVEAEANRGGRARHVIGRHLNWNDRECGSLYRQDQIRELVRVMQIVEDAEPEAAPKPAFLNVKDRHGMSYRSVAEVLNSSSLRLAVLQQAEKDLLAFEQRYRTLEEICQLVRVARDRVREAREQHENRPQ